MERIIVDYSKTLGFLKEEEIENIKSQIIDAHNKIHNKSGAGKDFLGWVTLPYDYDKEEFERIIKAADRIRNNSQIFIVIGIGGSYLGARAAIEMLNHSFYNLLPDQKKVPSNFLCRK